MSDPSEYNGLSTEDQGLYNMAIGPAAIGFYSAVPNAVKDNIRVHTRITDLSNPGVELAIRHAKNPPHLRPKPKPVTDDLSLIVDSFNWE
ncbi:hypothetical protein HOA92_04565 [archaeon]|jgi:hypothetical protein|nr:hypothetical protein [archaeon]MBT6762289.1 hypothetical protein [archaeon]